MNANLLTIFTIVVFSQQDGASPEPKKARHDALPPGDASTSDAETGAAIPGAARGEAAPSSHRMSPEPEQAEDSAGGDELEGQEQPEDDDDRPQDEGELTPLPDSPISDKDNIRQKFLVDMPKDFYSFLKFCKSLDKDVPQG